MKCPACAIGYIKDTPTQYRCNECEFFIAKTIAGRKIEPETAYYLIKNKETGILKGFISKKNKEFSARLKVEGKRIVFDFANIGSAPTLEPININIHSSQSGVVRLNVSGSLTADRIIPYGHIPAKQAQCFALLTTLHVMDYRGIIERTYVSIEIGNPDVALYLLKERKPRDKDMLYLLDLIWAKLDKCKGWKVAYEKPRKAMLIDGDSQTDTFPEDIFLDMDVYIDKKPGFSIIEFPKDRPDIYAQFEASISTAKKVADRVGKYYVQNFAEKRLLAWILAVKGGIG